MLFSATLDSGVNVLVKRFLVNPATHEADSAQSPVATMDHHVLHVHRDHRVPVLVDLASAPGRTVVFTRTKHGAKALARQLNARGVPTVELHGNLAQNARTRNMEAFHSGKATTLVATDIAARGIHVDDVAAGHPRRPAGRAQGLPAPLGPHRARRCRRHRRHADDRPAGQGRPRPDPCSRITRPRPGLRSRATRVLASSPPVSGCSLPVASSTTVRPGRRNAVARRRRRKPSSQRSAVGGTSPGRLGQGGRSAAATALRRVRAAAARAALRR